MARRESFRYYKDVRKVEISEQEYTIQTSRSGGPGGQHVNKVETQVELRWPYLLSQVLTESQKTRIAKSEEFRNRINSEDEIILQVSDTRSQLRNKEIAHARLHELLFDALKPQKPRKKTRPTKASKEKRIQDKRKNAEKKSLRKDPDR